MFELLIECSHTDVHEFDLVLDAVALAATRYREF